MLYFGLKRAGVYRARPGWLRLVLRVGGAGAAMCGFILWVNFLVGSWTEIGQWAQIGWLTVAVAGGASVYFAAAILLGLRPADLRMRRDLADL
jgi:putative peptidoglycan lipid II flippase